ncbi:protein FAM180B [Betta splendens]|uniref:Protein FAM180B n=1 Tax=Betta splendens TaxID=158456 RepID=A0A6P7MNU0_BETSP|nr:protein FAM180B [Betta splendens]
MEIKLCLRVFVGLWFSQVLQDVAADTNPTAGSSVSDANLMFEILLGGVEINQDNNVILLDQELASMRLGQAFFSQINDNVPKGLSSMGKMVTTLQGQRRPLTHTQFETLVLSMVYSAHQSWHHKRRTNQDEWSEVLLQLANVTVRDLRGSHLFNYA